MPKSRINGIDLAYETRGRGFPLVMAHGFGASRRAWEPQFDAFSKKYRFITYDSRGHGETESPLDASQYSQEIFAEDLAGLLGYLKINQAFVGGFSMGGGTALHCVFNHPEMVKAAIICATGSGSNDIEVRNKRAQENITIIKEKGIRTFFDPQLNTPEILDLQKRNPGLYEKIKAMRLGSPSIGLINTLQSVMMTRSSIFTLKDKLEKVNVPVLIIVGAQDEECVEPSKFMHEHIPNSELVIIENSTHWVGLWQASKFNEAVLNFLEKVEVAV